MPPSTVLRPEDLIPEVIFSPERAVLSADDQEKLKNPQIWLRGTEDLLCRACGWNTYAELTSSYLPRLRILHTRANSGLWNLGVDWVMWDRPMYTDAGNDYMTFQFLKEQNTTKIPLVGEMHQFGSAEEQFQFTVMSRAKGKTLDKVWDGLSAEEKYGYAQQLIAALRELRQFTSTSSKRVDGSPLRDNILGNCPYPTTCKNIENTKDEWFDNMAEE
jgi:hypothetical protein